MRSLSSFNPRLLEITFLLIIFIILSFISFSAAGLMSLGFIWNWTLQFDLEKVKSNKRYKFSTLRLVFTLNELVTSPFVNNSMLSLCARIIPAGLFWAIVSWFLGSLAFWWAPFAGSALLELINLLIHKNKVSL